VGAAGLGALLVGRGLDGEASQTMAFATIALGELGLVFAVRSPVRAAWTEGRNPWLAAGAAASAAMVALVVYLPPLHEPFGTVSLDGPELASVLGFAIAPFAIVELGKSVVRTRRGRRADRGSNRA
jgi:Ca2+-transporting ATPase